MSARLAEVAIGWDQVVNLDQKEYFKLGILPYLDIRKVGIGSDTTIEFDIWNGGNRYYIQGNFYGGVFESSCETSEHASITFDIFYKKIVKAIKNKFTKAERE
jgi:hypothetical protein